MDIIVTLLTQEIIRQNKCQMRFIDKSVLKQSFDKKLMINVINFQCWNLHPLMIMMIWIMVFLNQQYYNPR